MNMKAIVTHYLPCKDRCTFPIVQWTIVHKYKGYYSIKRSGSEMDKNLFYMESPSLFTPR